MNKRIILCLFSLVLLIALAAPALAAGSLPDLSLLDEDLEFDGDISIEDALYVFVARDQLGVYEEPDRQATVFARLPLGTEVMVEEISDDGLWYGFTYYPDDYDENDPDAEGIFGWIYMKFTSVEPPEEEEEEEEDEPIPTEHEHQWSQWTTVSEATCTKEGLRTRACVLCGEEQSQSIEKLGHQYGAWTVTLEATCTEEGEKVRRCTVCGYRQTKEVEKLPHDYGEWRVTVEATCTAPGEKIRRCKECRHKDTLVIDKLPHTYGAWTVTRAATCTAKGEQARTCTVCGARETRAIDMVPHTYSGWQVVVQATDHSAGTRAQICQVCGDRISQSFDPEGTLRRGQRGDAVREAQQLLADQGYLKGSVDGIFGPGVERAVTQFQRDQGLTPDGILWPQTINRLHHDFFDWEVVTPLTRDVDGELMRVCKDCGYEEHATLKAGTTLVRRDRGETVRSVQNMLNDLGYSAGAADGAYGPKLDAAFTAFAAEYNLDYMPGQVLPTDVDALTDAWIFMTPDNEWMGKGNRASAVNLVLQVTPAEDDPGEGAEARSFDWTLTNVGTGRARFVALLLGYGDECDFRANNLVVVLDGTDLRASGADTLSGSFGVASDWGEGKLNFCALAVETRTGAKWLSNVKTFEP